jgi:hypothetical protein
VGSSPKAQVVPHLEDEGHWKRGTFPKTRKLEMGCLGIDFFYLCHFWAIFYVFWQKSPSFAPSFQKLLPQVGSNK